MRYLALTIASALILLVIVLSGCENGMSSSGSNSIKTDNQNQNNIPEKNIPLKLNIKLMPHETYTLNYINTGFKVIDFVYIEKCGETDKSLEVIGYADDELILINCGITNAALLSVDFANRSSREIEFTVYLTGKKSIPIKKDEREN